MATTVHYILSPQFFLIRYQQLHPTEQELEDYQLENVRMAPRSSFFEPGSSLPRNLRARLLRRILDTLLQTPLHHPRRGKGSFNRGGRRRSGNAAAWRAANIGNSSTNANHRGNLVMPQGGPVMVAAYCPRHG